MPAMPLGMRDFSLLRAHDAAGMDIRTRLTARDSGGPRGVFGRVAEVATYWEPGAGPFPMPPFYEVLVEIMPPAGMTLMMCDAPILIAPSPRTFAVMYEVSEQGRAAGIMDRTMETLRFDVGLGQPLLFENPAVHLPPDPCAPRFRVTFELRTMGGAAGPDPDPDVPLVTAALDGDFIPAGAAGLEAASAPAEPWSLRAIPSIMRTRTELRFGGRFAAPASLVLYDVTGRPVRVLRALPGETRAIWDGRDAAGQEAPSGVYIARLSDGRDRTPAGRVLATRIVKLR